MKGKATLTALLSRMIANMLADTSASTFQARPETASPAMASGRCAVWSWVMSDRCPRCVPPDGLPRPAQAPSVWAPSGTDAPVVPGVALGRDRPRPHLRNDRDEAGKGSGLFRFAVVGSS